MRVGVGELVRSMNDAQLIQDVIDFRALVCDSIGTFCNESLKNVHCSLQRLKRSIAFKDYAG